MIGEGRKRDKENKKGGTIKEWRESLNSINWMMGKEREKERIYV